MRQPTVILVQLPDEPLNVHLRDPEHRVRVPLPVLKHTNVGVIAEGLEEETYRGETYLRKLKK